MFTIHGIDLEVDTFDAEAAGKYEEALKKVEKTSVILEQDMSLKNKIIKVCKIIYEAIDSIFGSGTSEKMFGDTYNIREASSAWHEIVIAVSKQSSEQAQIFMAEMKADESAD